VNIPACEFIRDIIRKNSERLDKNEIKDLEKRS
jgi:hypothetical protein